MSSNYNVATNNHILSLLFSLTARKTNPMTLLSKTNGFWDHECDDGCDVGVMVFVTVMVAEWETVASQGLLRKPLVDFESVKQGVEKSRHGSEVC